LNVVLQPAENDPSVVTFSFTDDSEDPEWLFAKTVVFGRTPPGAFALTPPEA